MHIDYLHWFIFFGGIGLIMTAIAKGIKPMTKKAIKWAISKDHPEVRDFVLEHREWIEAQFKAIDEAATEALEEEAAPTQEPK